MNEKNIRLVTAESVRAGHPDKFCDQVADAILDAHLRQDLNARVAVEVFATAGKIVVGGEITSKAKVSYDKIVAGVINRIDYTMSDLCGDPHDLLELETRTHEQSPDISAAVGKAELGAGDQGIVVGYATSETEEYLPLPVVLAHRICRRLDELKPSTPWLGADGKAQVTVAYENDVPVAVTAVVVSLQHDAEIDHKSIRRFIGKEVLGKVLPRELLKEDARILVNPSGKFALGGPAADTGLTGRKLAVDQYGPVAHIGGGALSGKDPTKVDRSGAYAARWVAKNIVAVGMAKRCEVQIAYAIGKSEPVSVATAWSPAAEDGENAITRLNDALQHLDGGMDDRMRALIDSLGLADQYASAEEFLAALGEIELIRSELAQQDSQLTLTFNRLTQAEGSIGKMFSSFVFGDENGMPYLDMSASSSSMKMRLTNTRLAFVQSGTEVAYFSDNKLYVTRLEAVEQISIGTAANGYLDIVTTPSGVGLKWRT